MRRGRADPEPLEVDDVRLVAAGCAVWLVALVVVLFAQGPGRWAWTCLAGFGLGLLGVEYCRRRRDAMRRDARRRAAETVAPPREPLT